jgi:hypothetical protein
MFQDRSSNVAAIVTGDTGFMVSGTLYFAGARLTVTGNSDAAMLGSQLISYDLTIGGNADLTVTWDSKTVARRRSIQLVE